MPIETFVELRDPFNKKISESVKFSRLHYARGVNRVGALVMGLSPEETGFGTLEVLSRPDRRINVMRSIDGATAYLDLETTWFTRKLELSETDGRKEYVLTCVDANHLLDRRYVAYYAGSAETDKTATFADDMLKEIVSENLSDLASDYGGSVTRGLAATLFQIQANLSRGAVLDKSFAWRNVLGACQEIADASRENGVYLAFDIVVSNQFTGMLEFRTYTDQRGIDRRQPSGTRPALFSDVTGNFKNPVLTFDYSEEVNQAYSGGQGEESARIVEEAADAARQKASPFNRVETFVNASHGDDPAAVEDEASAAVFAGKPRVYLTGDLIDARQAMRGVHWDFGDIVTAQAHGFTFDFTVDGVEVDIAEDGTYSNKVTLQQYD